MPTGYTAKLYDDEPQTFEEWANEMGYDSDSRKSERIYRAVSEQTGRLREFLGFDEFTRSVYDEEHDRSARRLAVSA